MNLLINFFTVAILVLSTKLQDKRILTSNIYANVIANPTDNFSNSDVGLRIIGGKEAKDAQFPYIAGLIMRNERNKRAVCGGSLISTTAVLTAGHCLYKKVSVSVTLGARSLSIKADEPEKQMRNSTNFIFHPNFNGSHSPALHDLAIIKLTDPIELNNNVKLIHIPANDRDDYAGKSGTTMGWGSTLDTTKKGNLEALLHISNTILTNVGCKRNQHWLKDVLLDTHMCQSGKGDKGTCTGDSGGPLVVNKVLVGVLSFGHEDCAEKHACVFTRLSKYINWINSNLH